MGVSVSNLDAFSTEQIVELIAQYLTERKWTVKEAFAFLDIDQNGTVAWDEFYHGVTVCLQDTRHSMTNDKLWAMFCRFDTNGDQRMSIQEMSSVFSPYGIGLYAFGHPTMAARSPGVASHSSRPRPGSTAVTDDIISRIAASLSRNGWKPEDLFYMVDVSHNRRLTRKQLEETVCRFEPTLSITERDAIFNRFDADHNNCIEIDEFCRTLSQVNTGALLAMDEKLKSVGQRFRQQGKNVSEAFAIFDRNNDGYLTKDEWRRAMQLLAPGFAAEDIEYIFNKFDTNKDTLLNIAEFHEFFMDSMQRSVSTVHATCAGGTASAPSAFYAAPAAGPVYAASSPVYAAAAPVYAAASPVYAASAAAVLPAYVPPPVEEPWETQLLDTVRSCLSTARSGFSISEAFRRLDYSNVNYLGVGEFGRMLRAYATLTDAQVEQVFWKVNVSRTGGITMGEFIRRFG